MTLEQSERRNKINSFLSHLNTKLQRQPVFCPKLHRLSGRTWEDHKWTCCRSGCREWSQWPDKQLRSQSADRVVRRSRGQFLALIAKSCKQVGGGWRAFVVVQQPVYEGWLVATASEVKVPIQPLCCCDTISKHRSSTAPAATKPRNAKLLSPTAAKSCHCQQLQSCPSSPFCTSLVDHLSSSCQLQDLALVIAAETFEKK